MNRFTKLTLTPMAFLCLALVLPAGSAVAEQKQHVSYKTAAANTKYTQQLNVDAGDAAGQTIAEVTAGYEVSMHSMVSCPITCSSNEV